MVTHSDIGCYIDTQKLVVLLRAEICNSFPQKNKANLRDLIAATGLVILLKLDSNIFFHPVWPRN